MQQTCHEELPIHQMQQKLNMMVAHVGAPKAYHHQKSFPCVILRAHIVCKYEQISRQKPDSWVKSYYEREAEHYIYQQIICQLL